MITTCPHCQTQIEIDPETLAALRGHGHFQCPACGGHVPVPQVARASLKLTAASVVHPSPSLTSARPPTNATHGLNRNLLILGTAALLVLGGIGFILASKKTGDTNTTTQNIRNEIINNAYFQNLIASGATTMRDLDSIAEIRPYQDGFIGISGREMNWQQANELAARTGSRIFDSERSELKSDHSILAWLKTQFAGQIPNHLWLMENGLPAVTKENEIVAVIETVGSRKAVFEWQPSRAATDIRKAIEIISQLGGKVIRDANVPGNPIVEVDLTNTATSDDGLASVARLEGIRKLNLHGCHQVGDDGLRAISGMTSLQSLNLYGCHRITDEGLQHLANLKNLHTLGIGYTGTESIKGSGLAHLSNLRGLRFLDMGHLRSLEPVYLKHIAHLSNLEILDINDCWEIGDESIDLLMGLEKLTTLRIRGTRFTDEGLLRLGMMRNLHTLVITKPLTEEEADGLEKEMGQGWGKSGYKRPQFTESGVRRLRESRMDLNLLRE